MIDLAVSWKKTSGQVRGAYVKGGETAVFIDGPELDGKAREDWLEDRCKRLATYGVVKKNIVTMPGLLLRKGETLYD